LNIKNWGCYTAEIDWGFAVRVAGIGFGTVFLVLIILSAAVWGVMGKIVSRFERKEERKS
jgi:Na+-transporting methylmalonyl-CoA/oxaloacetate decarboxylase gamma subunit